MAQLHDIAVTPAEYNRLTSALGALTYRPRGIYHQNDVLLLREYHPHPEGAHQPGSFTGRLAYRQVAHIHQDGEPHALLTVRDIPLEAVRRQFATGELTAPATAPPWANGWAFVEFTAESVRPFAPALRSLTGQVRVTDLLGLPGIVLIPALPAGSEATTVYIPRDRLASLVTLVEREATEPHRIAENLTTLQFLTGAFGFTGILDEMKAALATSPPRWTAHSGFDPRG